MERYLKLCSFHWKTHLWIPTLLSVLLCLITPCIMGTKNLDAMQTAKILEQYICFIGIILCMTVYTPEIDHEIRDLVRSKRENMIHLYVLRLFEAVVVFLFISAGVLIRLEDQNCSFSFSKLMYGTLANGLFLGGLGMLSYALFDQIVLAYLFSFAYYFINFITNDRYVGKFYLFGMMKGEFVQKHFLLIGGIIMISGSIGIRKKY